MLRAKYLVRLPPEEQRKAIQRWKDECNVSDRVELQPTSVPSAAGAVSEEESTDSVLPASETPFQTCSRDGLIKNTSFSLDIQDESGGVQVAWTLKRLNLSKKTNTVTFGGNSSCAKLCVGFWKGQQCCISSTQSSFEFFFVWRRYFTVFYKVGMLAG